MFLASLFTVFTSGLAQSRPLRTFADHTRLQLGSGRFSYAHRPVTASAVPFACVRWPQFPVGPLAARASLLLFSSACFCFVRLLLSEPFRPLSELRPGRVRCVQRVRGRRERCARARFA
eukprot:6173281-Pleurochrysis_carterae.AAC.1